jgi:hypothetical protein
VPEHVISTGCLLTHTKLVRLLNGVRNTAAVVEQLSQLWKLLLDQTLPGKYFLLFCPGRLVGVSVVSVMVVNTGVIHIQSCSSPPFDSKFNGAS